MITLAAGGSLRVRGLAKSFGGVTALAGVDIDVAAGELVGLIGPNGSGKTTAVDCITGFTQPDRAAVEFDGRDITGMRPDQLAGLGLIRTFQQVRVFASMTVRDNVAAGAFASPRRRGPGRAGWAAVDRSTGDIIAMLNLGEVADRPAGAISYGQRKLVELGTALLGQPTMLVLDEPVAAINPTLAGDIQAHILELNRAGTTVLLIEHNMEVVVGLCRRIIVLDQGSKIAEGTPAEVMARPDVQEAYFGR
ncbi:MAG: ABC transporter ATP-binding protein [Acidimicrobiales bacterium]